MTSVLLGLQIVLAVLIVVVVLLQKSSSIGLGAYSGSNESLFGAKGPASFMAKLTMFLGLLFVINTITLGYLYNKEYGKSILDETKTNKELSPLVPSAGTLNPMQETPTNPLLIPQTKTPSKEPLNPLSVDISKKTKEPAKPHTQATQEKPKIHTKPTHANTHKKQPTKDEK
ncbi:preprotein translocase subunit SecG [Helicobacter cetorum]|uniref:Protein-export membrane protein SecG n=1 Tax=Helicobacter cetorum (strain ATCC BAA-540 / CCUG 52418 / MIT 99-5656) TaxID=1163745 RepID=I0EQ90_HELCM|nr:preprotein translocase subunit SecG [Helicobacter cetorum]AFI05109.1 preprotein translocase subunit SecG [Helicobacter cetorum MIT 99-5656]